MTAPRFICRNTKKTLAERGPSIHDGEGGLLAYLTEIEARP